MLICRYKNPVDKKFFVSALVGKACGVAPKANVYYYAADDTNRTQVYFAEAILDGKISLLEDKAG